MADNNFTMEQLEAAKTCQSPEELLTKAKEQGIDISPEQAAAFLGGQTGELADEELDNVAGGYCHDDNGREVVTLVTKCCHGITEQFINSIRIHPKIETRVQSCGGISKCKALSYEKGIWYCNFNVMSEEERKFLYHY